MAQLSKAALLSDITINIHTNTIRSIKGDIAQARLINLMDSTLNKTDDANVNNGYMAIDSTGHADVTKIKSIIGSVGKFLRDDGTWAFAVVAPGVTNGHIPYQDASNDLADTPLVYDVANSRITLPIPLYISSGAGAKSILTSDTDDYYTGAGNDPELAAATLYSRTYYSGAAGAGNLWQADLANGTTIASLSMQYNTLGGIITDGSTTGDYFIDVTGFTGSATTGSYASSFSQTINTFAVTSDNPSYLGFTYDGATVAGFVAANATDNTCMHRLYNDLRYAPIVSGGYLPLSGGAMTGPISYSGTSNGTALVSTADDYFIGAGNTNDLGNTASKYSAAWFSKNGSFLNLSAYDVSGNETDLSLDNTTNIARIYSGINGVGNISFGISKTYGGLLSSSYTDCIGFNYDAITAGYVNTNQTQYSILHRLAGDGRWAQLSGAIFTGNVNGVTPTQLTYLSGATSNIQNQLNNINSGLSWKVAARILVDSNVTIASPGASLDGVTMAAGDRVVLTAETLGKDNGVYVWNGAAIPMTRSTDCSTGGTGSTGVLGMTINIEEGTYADQMWVLTTNAPITVGTTSLIYAKSSATTYTGSNGITLTGNNFTLDNSYFSGAFTLSGGVATIGAAYVTSSMLAAMTSANLASIISDETGSGALVFATSPTFTTPILGIASATSLAITGTGGNGFATFLTQSSQPSYGASGFVFYANSLGRFSWRRQSDTYERSFAGTLTADRIYTLPDYSATLATLSGTESFTNKRITARTGTVASSATPTINTDTTDYYSITALAAAITSMTTNLSGTPNAGDTLWISITDNGTARAITWGASFESSGTATLPTTTVISTRLDVSFIWNESTTKWRCTGSS